MRNYTSLLFTGLFALSMLLCACDPSTRHRKIIINDSDYDLYIVPVAFSGTTAGYVSDSILVSRHSEVTILERQHISRPYEYKNCETFVDSIRTYVAGHDSLQVIKDLDNPINWIYFLLKESKMSLSECECRIQIRNEDVQ